MGITLGKPGCATQWRQSSDSQQPLALGKLNADAKYAGPDQTVCVVTFYGWGRGPRHTQIILIHGNTLSLESMSSRCSDRSEPGW